MQEDQRPEIPEFIEELLSSGKEIEEIKIDAEGDWYHNGAKFTNPSIIEFFNKSIDITKDGKYVIAYDKFVYPIVVEDTPIFITGIKIEGKGAEERVYINLSSSDAEVLDIKTLHYKNSTLYCVVKNGKFPARFKRSPSFELLFRLEETDDVYYIDICGQRIVLAEKM